MQLKVISFLKMGAGKVWSAAKIRGQTGETLTEKEEGDKQADHDDVEKRVLEYDPTALAFLLRREQRRANLLRWAQPDCNVQ